MSPLALVFFIACDPPVTDTSVDPETDTDLPTTTLVVTPIDATAFEGATVALFPLDTTFFAVLSETPIAPASLVDGAFTFTYTPGPDALVDAPWATDLKVAGYAVVAYQDAPDAAGLLGITRFDAVYLEGTVPEPYAALGLHEGWNAMRADDEGPPFLGDPLALALEANLLNATTVTATGTWDTPVEGLVAGFSTEDTGYAIGTTAATDPWSITATGDPSPSTWFTGGDVTVAGFRLGAFTDVDTSRNWTASDVAIAVGVTATDEPAWLAWGAPVVSAHEAHVLVTRGGFRVGWSVVKGTEGSTPLAPDDTLRLVAGTP